MPEADTPTSEVGAENFLTIAEVAYTLGRSYAQIQRATVRGLIPFYRPFGRRKLLLLSEVVAAMKVGGLGGDR